ncbi:MAG: polysaccharide deacetylase family protein [Bacteroidota bacterium]|nr:polysaccharide deacetylase family protein [Bacteroidota bacterium]
MTSPPLVPIVIDCSPAFARRARYTATMLGLAAGFLPRFLPPAESRNARLIYAYEAPSHGGDAVFLPASRAAHAFLARKNRYDITACKHIAAGDLRLLSLFPVEASEGCIGTDLLSDAFFFLSLHEEWSVPERDAFGRLPVEASLLGAAGILDRPVVAEYAAFLRKVAGVETRAERRFSGRCWAVCLTHDIDYMTKFTPGFAKREALDRFILDTCEKPLRDRTRRFARYAKGFLTRRDPPAVCLARIIETESRFGTRGTYFFKAGATDKRDERYSLNCRAVRKAFETLRAGRHEIGLHTSYRCPDEPGLIQRERDLLADAFGETPRSMRGHYLRFRYPDSWSAAVALGFDIDSTLGFAGREGFRNGCCHPFLPYDLESENVLPIWEVPLHAMDGTFRDYLHLSAGESMERIDTLARVVERFGGVLTLLFHNLVYDEDEYPGWGSLFERWADPSGRHAFTGTLHETLGEWLGSLGVRSIEEVQKTILDGELT